MVGVAELSMLMTSLKGVKDLTEAMVGLRDAAAFQTKAIELQSKIMDVQNAAFAAQEERSALVERVRGLEKEVTRLEEWASEKKRYILKDTGNGTLAYALKPEMADSEPPHWICAGCYQSGQKSILQPETRLARRTQHLVCHVCGSDLIIGGVRDTPLPTHTNNKRR